MTAKIVVVASAKGGVGKTTTTATIATGLARRNQNILAIDLDPQGHLSTALGYDPQSGVFDYLVGDGAAVANSLFVTERPGVTLLPGNSRTRTAQTLMQIEQSTDYVARRLAVLGSGYDYLVLDTPPSGLFQEVALSIADVLIIPTRLEVLSIDGVANTIAMARKIGKQPFTVILPVGLDRRVQEHSENLQQLTQHYGPLVFAPVPQRIAVAESSAVGQTIWEYTSASLVDVRSIYANLLSAIQIGQMPPATSQGRGA